MAYIFEENINAVIPDNQFRKRNPVFAESELYNRYKGERKKTRKAKTNAALPSSEFTVNLETNTCICPAGKELLFLGDDFETEREIYTRFRGKLPDCRSCPLQSSCMKNPVKEQGRQVSFLNKEQKKISCLDLMKEKVDSQEGRRMLTIELVFGNICGNKGLDHISLRGEKKCTA
jgi:hypothetical protein